MPLRLDVKKKLATRSERVKSVDLHPTEPWVLAALYNGTMKRRNSKLINCKQTRYFTNS